MTKEQDGGIFSIRERREVVRERARARLDSQAHAKRVVARLASESRVRALLDLMADAERKMLVRIAEKDFTSFLAQAKAALARLAAEDRPATFGASEETAAAIEADA